MRYVVILADLNKQTWYAPVVEAFTPKGATRAAQERYEDCIPIAALGENEIQHMLTAIRSKPDIVSAQTYKDALIEKWVEIGRQNIWYSNAPDQFFGEHSFKECCSVRDLYGRLARKDWYPGQAFFLGNLAFINRGDNEWLVIKDDVPFESESISADLFTPEAFAEWYKHLTSSHP